jgi:hypothetical protein
MVQGKAPSLAQMIALKIDLNATGDLIPADAAKTIRVHKLFIMAKSGDVDVVIRDGPDDLTGPMPMLQYGSLMFQNDGEPWFVSSAGQAIRIALSAGVQVVGIVHYTKS